MIHYGRPSVEVDGLRRPRRLEDLSRRERDLFVAQMAAYAAGVALVHEQDAHREAGQYATGSESVRFLNSINDRFREWNIARDSWRWLRASPGRRL